MNKSTWITLILVATLGLIYWVTKKEIVSVGVKRLTMPAFVKDDIDRIELDSLNDVIFLKTGNDWFVEQKREGQDKKFLADNKKITLLLEAASALRHSYYVSNSKEKLSEYGFNKENETLITLSSKNNKVWSLLLGKNSDASGKYAKLPDDDFIYVVRAPFNNVIRADVNDWREKKIVTLPEENITKIAFYHSSEIPYIVLKKENDAWSAQEQESFRLSKENIANFIKRALNTYSLSFVDEKPELKNSIFHVEFLSKDEVKQKLSFYKQNEDYLVENDATHQLYKISEYSFNEFNKNIEDFRDLAVIKIDQANIKKIIINDEKEKISVELKDDKWELIEPKNVKDFTFDPQGIVDFFSHMSRLKGKSLADLKENVPEDPKWQDKYLVELVDKSDKSIFLRTANIKKDDKYLLVKGNADDQIYLLNKNQLGFLRRGLKSFEKSNVEMPVIDERTKGFENLPIEIKRQLLKNNEEIKKKNN